MELLEKQKAAKQTKQCQEFFDCVHDQIGKDATINDLVNDYDDTILNSFVYLRDDGGKTSSEPLWKELEILLLDKSEEPHLDDDGEPITIIAKDTKSLHSIIFLTKPDKHGEQHQFN